jgi:putative transposase
LSEHGIAVSMSRPGNRYDNAVAESFFGTLKTELVNPMRYGTKEEARTSIFQWIPYIGERLARGVDRAGQQAD